MRGCAWPERVDADAGDEIEIALAIEIVNVRALPAAQNQRIAGIVLQKVFAFQVHDGLGSGRGFDGWLQSFTYHSLGRADENDESLAGRTPGASRRK